MKRKPDDAENVVAHLSNHPREVLKRLRRVVENSDNIQWSFDINDLELARKVQIRTILRCLREGELDASSLKVGGEYVNGIMSAVLGGVMVRVEFFLGPADSGLTVVDAEAEEE